MCKTYEHSAYFYAYRYGWTYSEARTHTERYLDCHTYRPRMKERPDGEWNSEDWFKWRNAPMKLDSTFESFHLAACAAADIGIAMRETVDKLTDPVERDRMKRELLRDLRRIRRPFYYAREVERRRNLAIERRKIRRRRTTAPMPTRDDVLAAWQDRKNSREAMIRLGGMIHDLECYVDNCLRFDEGGNVIGRNRGIRGWIDDNVPELNAKYKTLMRYKAMAMRLRQATETKDPAPTSKLLKAPLHEVVEAVLADEKPVFAHVFAMLEHLLAPRTVMLDAPVRRERRRRADGRRS